MAPEEGRRRNRRRRRWGTRARACVRAHFLTPPHTHSPSSLTAQLAQRVLALRGRGVALCGAGSSRTGSTIMQGELRKICKDASRGGDFALLCVQRRGEAKVHKNKFF